MPNRSPAQRRRWHASLIVSLFFMAVAAAAGTGWWYARESPPHQGPIVLISVASMSPATLPSAGGNTRTPALSALIADSVLFTHAYTHSPQLLPAHASLLTGRLPFEHGVRDDGGYVLADDAKTLAEQLRNRGFATGAVVSSFLLRRGAGLAQGFSFYDGGDFDAASDPPPAVTRDGVAAYETAEQWLRMQGGQRFFLFLGIEPAALNAVVDRLVAHLKQRKLYDGATIVVTAARGGDDENGVWLSDRSLAVPLIVKLPDEEGAGRHVATAVQHIDVFPTLLDFVRAPIPGGIRGRSLRPILDKRDGVIQPQPIYAESLEAAWRFGGDPVYAITVDGYRFTHGADDAVAWVGDGPQQGSAADEHRAEQLKAALDRLLKDHPVQPPSDIAAADAPAFAAAGYLAGVGSIEPLPAPLARGEQGMVSLAHRAAVARLAAGDSTGTITALKSIAERHADFAPVQLQIGSLLARTGHVTESIPRFEAAAMLRPDDPEVVTTLAGALLRARQVDAAQMYADAAIVLAEKSGMPRPIAAAHEVAVRIALAQSDADGARLHADAAQHADPSLPMPAFVRGRIAFDEGDYEAALTALQEAEKVAADSKRGVSELHLLIGDTLAQLQRYDDAEAEFKAELDQFPENIRAYSSLALLYRASNREDAAAETIDDLLRASPTPEGYALAARLWTLAGERARADAVRADARKRFRGTGAAATLN